MEEYEEEKKSFCILCFNIAMATTTTAAASPVHNHIKRLHFTIVRRLLFTITYTRYREQRQEIGTFHVKLLRYKCAPPSHTKIKCVVRFLFHSKRAVSQSKQILCICTRRARVHLLIEQKIK